MPVQLVTCYFPVMSVSSLIVMILKLMYVRGCVLRRSLRSCQRQCAVNCHKDRSMSGKHWYYRRREVLQDVTVSKLFCSRLIWNYGSWNFVMLFVFLKRLYQMIMQSVMLRACGLLQVSSPSRFVLFHAILFCMCLRFRVKTYS